MAESIGTGITKGITTVNWNLTEEVRVAPMDKKLLSDYIDACELIRETEQQIRRLQDKQSETTQDSVRGSNPEFPYNAQHFKIEGTTFSMRDDARLLEKKKLLADRRAATEETRVQVERWMVTIPAEDYPVEALRGTYMGRDGGEAGAEGDRGQCTKRI